MAEQSVQEKLAIASRLRDVAPREALDAVEAVRALLRSGQPPESDDRGRRWRAECALSAAWAYVRLGRFTEAFPEADEGLRLFRELGDERSAAGCLLVIGIAKGEEGRNDEAVQFCQEAEALFSKAGDQAGRARAINASGTSYRRMGDSARAIEAYGTSMSIARSNGDSLGVARALTNIGYVYLYERKFEQAIEYARRALLMERGHSNLAGELSNCCNLVQALVGAGRPQEAIDFMGAYDLKALSRSGLFSFLELSESLSTAYLSVGRFADADALLKLGIGRARRDGNYRELSLLLCTLARSHRMAPAPEGAPRAKQHAAAREALEEALVHGRSRDWDFVQTIHEEFCTLCREEGRWDEALEHLKQAHKVALRLSSASADERLARQRSEQEAAHHKARADAEARQHEIERKALQAQRTESLGVMAGGIVHHFNNLLTSILGNAELAELDAGHVAEALAQIKESGRRAADLCQQIMMYTGRAEARMAPVDLPALIHESIKLLRVTLVADCEVVCEFPNEPVLVWGDRAQLQQIILNVLTNSAEANATTVLLKTGAPRAAPAPDAPGGTGDYVELSITDNGGGMAPEVLARVFEPFFSTKFTGRGLGLPAAMGLVRAHRGTMTVESTPGSGTTVKVELPAAAARAPEKPRQAIEIKPTGPRVALIVEDEEAVRRVIVRYLGSLGWKTLEATDGEDAVRTHRDYPGQIDLMLCDYLMPRMNGLKAAREIRRSRPGLPVIFMSGFTKEETGENFKAEGFEYFLTKPFQLIELQKLLQITVEPGP
jgi:signal transduction histidine kinase